MKNTVYLIANGDLRSSANQNCEKEQVLMEEKIVAAIEREGHRVKRAYVYDPVKKHGFIDSQKYGMQVFRDIPAKAPLVVAEAVWQYSHHILPGLSTHEGPILHMVLQGIDRDQMMARHKANHIQVVYAPDKKGAKTGLYAKAAAMNALGIEVHLCGDI